MPAQLPFEDDDAFLDSLDRSQLEGNTDIVSQSQEQLSQLVQHYRRTNSELSKRQKRAEGLLANKPLKQLSFYDKMFALYRYLYWVDELRGEIEKAVKRYPAPEGSTDYRCHLASFRWATSLYVVIEGWTKLKMAEPSIDAFLTDTAKIARLRKLRHTMFHFEPDMFHEDIRAVINSPELGEWAVGLNLAFETHLKHWAKNQKVDESNICS